MTFDLSEQDTDYCFAVMAPISDMAIPIIEAFNRGDVETGATTVDALPAGQQRGILLMLLAHESPAEAMVPLAQAIEAYL